MSKSIYVVTHPEATHHIHGVVGGWFDSDLTERGVEQAETIASSLVTRLDGATAEILSSDLLRARRTAEVIAKRLQMDVTLDPDLREKSYGEAEGKPRAWLTERVIPLPEIGERLRHDEGIPGAETRMDLAERAYRVIDGLQHSPHEQHILVTHGGTSTLLIAAWIGMPIDAAGLVNFQVSSGSITVLRKDSRNFSHQLAQLNDVSHLA
ncbi:histidine phosphatase family protein [Nocardioides iriomotensis]|uniref:histidine phosphatase family protein n=1 Tax=Nocardioides iriomotensis TaxID=715784 RepID=UPI001F11228A|nr:histidine phosphatase family protein [Nocardioides iriomotensis]